MSGAEHSGGAEVCKVGDPRFLARVGHEPTRTLLAEVGLPKAAMKIFTLAERFARGMETWAEHLAAAPESIWADPDAVPGSEQWFLVGRLLYSTVALDGATGAVYLLPEIGGDPERLNQSLDTFLGFLGAFDAATQECAAEEKEPTPGTDYMEFSAAVGARLGEQLRQLDPEALATADGIWGNTLFEITEGMY
jgi:hypothetical protein